ncbi:MAG: M23 family metallopeptidase [Chitinophagaceae bacterium]|nr:M23 family metallopeptidase [Chitinophagaceae bacterium]
MKTKLLHLFPSLILLLAVLLTPAFLTAQTPGKYPRGYFRWPLNLNPEIVANLGELRPNHWHMGLDIRTNQKENIPVYAAAGGYIAKVRIERSGFGRCIWINHPNGLTTLYAHLNNFNPALEAYITDQQYQRESWAVDLELPADKFPVTKGQFIAYSGNTGGSQGPHVHFEIRNTATDECLNPLLFGFPLQDNVPPSLLKLSMYNRTGSIYEQALRTFPLRKIEGSYIIPKMPVVKTGWQKISFGLQAIDRIKGSANEDGIYAADFYLDDQMISGFRLDSISYQETGYMNAHIDYKYRFNGGPYFQHLSKLPGDQGGVYYSTSADGAIQLMDTNIHEVKVQVWDAYGNQSELLFKLQFTPDAAQHTPVTYTSPLFVPNQRNVLKREGFEVELPETVLYDSLHSFHYRNNSFPENAVSALHQLNDPSVPVHDELIVRIKPDRAIGGDAMNKLVIQRSYRNSTQIKKAAWSGEWLTAAFGDFGNFQAFVDQEPPVLNDLGRGDTVDLSPASRIVFQPRDNFGMRTFRAELDGKWLRFTNDKSRAHIYVFDDRCPYGVHELKVTVEDLVGNVTTKSWWFKKYPYTPPKKKATIKKKTRSKPGNASRKPAPKKKTTVKKR